MTLLHPNATASVGSTLRLRKACAMAILARDTFSPCFFNFLDYISCIDGNFSVNLQPSNLSLSTKSFTDAPHGYDKSKMTLRLLSLLIVRLTHVQNNPNNVEILINILNCHNFPVRTYELKLSRLEDQVALILEVEISNVQIMTPVT